MADSDYDNVYLQQARQYEPGSKPMTQLSTQIPDPSQPGPAASGTGASTMPAASSQSANFNIGTSIPRLPQKAANASPMPIQASGQTDSGIAGRLADMSSNAATRFGKSWEEGRLNDSVNNGLATLATGAMAVVPFAAKGLRDRVNGLSSAIGFGEKNTGSQPSQASSLASAASQPASDASQPAQTPFDTAGQGMPGADDSSQLSARAANASLRSSGGMNMTGSSSGTMAPGVDATQNGGAAQNWNQTQQYREAIARNQDNANYFDKLSGQIYAKNAIANAERSGNQAAIASANATYGAAAMGVGGNPMMKGADELAGNAQKYTEGRQGANDVNQRTPEFVNNLLEKQAADPADPNNANATKQMANRAAAAQANSNVTIKTPGANGVGENTITAPSGVIDRFTPESMKPGQGQSKDAMVQQALAKVPGLASHLQSLIKAKNSGNTAAYLAEKQSGASQGFAKNPAYQELLTRHQLS